MFLLIILRDLNLHDKWKYETELREFFLSDFLMVTARYLPMLEIWQNGALQFFRKQNQDISILTKIHVTHDQIHPIRNNMLGPIFFVPGDSHTEGLLALIHSGFEGVTEVDIDAKKEGLCHLKLFPLIAEFSVSIPIQRTAG